MTYSISILAPDIARHFGLPLENHTSAKVIDAYGAALVMAVGSAIAAVTFIVAAAGPAAGFFAALLLMQLTSSMVLYQAAFLALVQTRPLGAGKKRICRSSLDYPRPCFGRSRLHFAKACAGAKSLSPSQS